MAEQAGLGMDHDHYGWDPLPSRPAWRWGNGAGVAVVPVLVLEVYEDPVPDWPQIASVGGGLARTPPNISRVSTREYGHRVGVFRLTEALAERGIRPVVAIDVMTAELYPFLVRHLVEAGAELVAHGLSVTRPITGHMAAEEERAYLAEVRRRLADCGVEARGWFGPEYGESPRTPGLLAEAGYEFVCDWCFDEQPVAMSTEPPLWALPLWADFDDQSVLVNRMADPGDYEVHLRDALDGLARDGQDTARFLSFCWRPWIMGQPFRIAMAERILDHALAAGAWFPTPSEVLDALAEQSVGSR